jgi:S-formylglutathione hydrolase FrmB
MVISYVNADRIRSVRRCLTLALLIVATVMGYVRSTLSASVDASTATKFAQEWLAARNPAERKRVAAKLDEYAGGFEAVIQILSGRSFKSVKSGYLPEEHFSDSSLRQRHPDDLLYFVVPKSYRPERATGLIVFLHGGGSGTTRKAPRATLDFPTPDSPPDTHRSGDMFAATGMITVGPSASWDTETAHRWCVADADQYLADVIEECKSRFNIDPDRVFLLGHSMGGFGAFHHVQRTPDRFAAVIANSGSWDRAYWPVIRGTPLCIVQGVHDARPGVRWHYTDIAYGRWTDKLLTADGIEHTYLEHNGYHGISNGRPLIAKYLEAAKDLRRDPYFPHIVLASPVGYGSSYCFPIEHNRWLTLNEATKGDLVYDEMRVHSDGSFSEWTLEHRTRTHPGSAIEAINRGDNLIEVSTQNVAKLTVWLHPRMIDVAKPVAIVVNGKTRFNGTLTPSLVTALESFERRRDWGLVYPMKVEIPVGRE